MIRHAWSVVASRALVDRETNVVNLDVLEQVNLTVEELPSEKAALSLPNIGALVTLWYYDGDAVPDPCEYRSTIYSPDGTKIGTVQGRLDFSKHRRLRTFLSLGGLPIVGAGIFTTTVEIAREDSWEQVASIPFEVRIALENSEDSRTTASGGT